MSQDLAYVAADTEPVRFLAESCYGIQHRQLKAAESVFLHRFYVVEQMDEKQER
jgi:hypothetical protein